MPIKFKDDSTRLQEEFDSKIDPRLNTILSLVAAFVKAQFDKELVVTCLLRDAAENAALPGSNPQSAHLRGDAADLRSRNFTAPEIESIIAFVKAEWGDMVHCIFHAPTGGAAHIHLNINWPYSVKNPNKIA